MKYLYAVGLLIMLMMMGWIVVYGKDIKLLSHLVFDTHRSENTYAQVKVGPDWNCQEKTELMESLKKQLKEVSETVCEAPKPYCGDGIVQAWEDFDFGKDEVDGCKKKTVERLVPTGGCLPGYKESKGECVRK